MPLILEFVLHNTGMLSVIIPIKGVVSVTGNMSPTMEENMVMASIMVTPEK